MHRNQMTGTRRSLALPEEKDYVADFHPLTPAESGRKEKLLRDETGRETCRSVRRGDSWFKKFDHASMGGRVHGQKTGTQMSGSRLTSFAGVGTLRFWGRLAKPKRSTCRELPYKGKKLSRGRTSARDDSNISYGL